jgi:hypothetical protein
MLLPKQLAGFRIDCVEVVGDAGFERDLLNAAACADLLDNQRRKQRMHLLRNVVEFDLPQDLQVLDVIFREDFLIRLEICPLAVGPIGGPVSAPRKRAGCGDRDQDDSVSHK